MILPVLGYNPQSSYGVDLVAEMARHLALLMGGTGCGVSKGLWERTTGMVTAMVTMMYLPIQTSVHEAETLAGERLRGRGQRSS